MGGLFNEIIEDEKEKQMIRTLDHAHCKVLSMSDLKDIPRAEELVKHTMKLTLIAIICNIDNLKTLFFQKIKDKKRIDLHLLEDICNSVKDVEDVFKTWCYKEGINYEEIIEDRRLNE